MKRSSAFTLAEVLITLAIIGVVAAMTIPGVIVRTNQQEFKTGFRKAISVLNQAVTMNLAIDNESPAEIANQTERMTAFSGDDLCRQVDRKGTESDNKQAVWSPCKISFCYLNT